MSWTEIYLSYSQRIQVMTITFLTTFAAVFAKVIKDSYANADMVIENLKMELEYE